MWSYNPGTGMWSARRVYASPTISEYFAADFHGDCGGFRAIRAVAALSRPHDSAESICHAATAGQPNPSAEFFRAESEREGRKHSRAESEDAEAAESVCVPPE